MESFAIEGCGKTTPSLFCFVKGSGNNRLLRSCSSRHVIGVQEIVTSLPGSRLGIQNHLCHQYPAIQELGYFRHFVISCL